MREDVRYKPADHVVAKFVGEELVLLDYEGEAYYGLDPIGARIWELFGTAPAVGEIIETLLAEYEVTREVLTADLETLIADLEKNGLVKIVTGDAP